MSGKRLFIPMLIALPFCLLFFPLLFFLIPAAIGLGISLATTTYRVKESSVEEVHDFLSKNVKEFTAEKVMGVLFREDIFDRWLGTCSVEFWSIGSDKAITFKHIEKSDALYEALREKFGFIEKPEIYRINSHFSFERMIKAELWVTLSVIASLVILLALLFIHPLFILIILLLAIMGICNYAYKSFYYDRSNMIFFKGYVRGMQGLIVKEITYAMFEDLKGVKTTKYPLTDAGTLRLDVAGERVVGSGRQQVLLSNHIDVKYVDDIEFKDELIDIIVHKTPSAAQIKHIEAEPDKHAAKNVLVAKPVVANTMLVWVGLTILASIFTLGLALLFLPFVIIGVMWSVKVKSYAIQNYRIIAKKGIFFKKQSSIVFEKIDHINKSEGALNKMFKNGNVTINTTGSSSPEITIRNIEAYNQFYAELRKHY